jgi:hypothetical protein
MPASSTAAGAGSASRQAKSLLLSLSADQRRRLVAAMAEVERLMRAAAVEISLVEPNSPVARWCLGEYFREIAERFADGFDPAASISTRLDELTPPYGCFVIARPNGAPIGCGVLKVRASRSAKSSACGSPRRPAVSASAAAFSGFWKRRRANSGLASSGSKPTRR